MLVQGDQQAALALFAAPSSSSCTPSTVLPAPEMPTTMVVEPSKMPPPIRASSGSTPMTERSAVGGRLSGSTRAPGLHAAEHLQPLAGGDAQRVLPGLIVLPRLFMISRLRWMPRWRCSRFRTITVSARNSATSRAEACVLVRHDLVREHRGQVLAVQPFDQLL